MGLLSSLKNAGKAQPMTPDRLMALYPHLFAQPSAATAPPAPPTDAVDYSQPGMPPPPPPLPPDFQEAQMPPEYRTLPPTTEPDMQPEPNAVTASAPADMGPSAPVTASNAPAKRKGLLGFLGDVGGAIGGLIAPEPGSFMDSAYQNTIYGAKRGQQDYQRAEAAKDLASQEAQIKLNNLRTKGEYQIAGNNIFHIKPDGSTEFIQPTPQETEQIRIYRMWEGETDPVKKQTLEQMLKGYQWSDWVLEMLRKTKVAGAQAAAAAKPPEGTITPGWVKEY